MLILLVDAEFARVLWAGLCVAIARSIHQLIYFLLHFYNHGYWQKFMGFYKDTIKACINKNLKMKMH